MRDYELTLILPSSQSEEEQEKILTKIAKIVEELKGKVEKKTAFGKKEFCFPIAKQTSGFYWLLNLSLTSPEVSPLTQKLKLNEEVLRFLLIRKE